MGKCVDAQRSEESDGRGEKTTASSVTAASRRCGHRVKRSNSAETRFDATVAVRAHGRVKFTGSSHHP